MIVSDAFSEGIGHCTGSLGQLQGRQWRRDSRKNPQIGAATFSTRNVSVPSLAEMCCCFFRVVLIFRYGTFSGINRKVQFKLLNKKDHDGGMQMILLFSCLFALYLLRYCVFCDLIAPLLLLILKWGGEHTQSGRRQAEELGRAFRIIYPGGEGEYASLPGSGFLRLHSTYRHDLKVYASDEGRVQMTAAAFTKVSTSISFPLAFYRKLIHVTIIFLGAFGSGG